MSSGAVARRSRAQAAAQSRTSVRSFGNVAFRVVPFGCRIRHHMVCVVLLSIGLNGFKFLPRAV